MTAEYRHIPVMAREVEQYLALRDGQVFCDCTLGGAGHSLILGRLIENDGLLIGIDRDEEAIAAADARLAATLPQLAVKLVQGNFGDLDDHLLKLMIPGVDAFLFDLGTSSHQLDSTDRGFSYSQDAPLDMRMDISGSELTAAEVVNSSSEAELARIFFVYGEERFSHRIAKAIVKRRATTPYSSTLDLANTIKDAIPAAARRSGGNPAKRSFQALRIYVNGELDALERGLDAALRWLNPGGRIVVLSYHSLEDRLVKRAFAEAEKGCICPPEVAICVCGRQSVFELLTRRPELPKPDELEQNSRSSSAKLRAISRRKEALEDNG